MGLIAPDPGGGDEEEPSGDEEELDLDLDVTACPECRRELLPWQDECPEHGVAGVPRTELPPTDGPPVPDHLLEDLDMAETDEPDPGGAAEPSWPSREAPEPE